MRCSRNEGLTLRSLEEAVDCISNCYQGSPTLRPRALVFICGEVLSLVKLLLSKRTKDGGSHDKIPKAERELMIRSIEVCKPNCKSPASWSTQTLEKLNLASDASAKEEAVAFCIAFSSKWDGTADLSEFAESIGKVGATEVPSHQVQVLDDFREVLVSAMVSTVTSTVTENRLQFKAKCDNIMQSLRACGTV